MGIFRNIFRLELSMDNSDNYDINDIILNMSNTMYNYFADNFGIIKHPEHVEANSFLLKYKEFLKQQLKQEYRKLKRNTPEDLRSIKFVAKLLRETLSGKQNAIYNTRNIDHGKEIRKNFWAYTIEIIDIECVLGHESCLYFFLSVPFEIRHIEFDQEWCAS